MRSSTLGTDRAEVYVALLTPVADDGGVAVDALRAHAEWLIEVGVDGLLVAGTTGEGPLLSDEEVLRAVECCLDASAGRAAVVAHVGRAGTAATVRLGQQALEYGVHELSAVVPYFYALNDDQLLAHYTELIRAFAPAAVLAYTIPVRTQNELSPAALDALATVGLRGVKDSTKSLERNAEFLAVAAAHPGFRVYMGSDGLAVDSLSAGASGVMSAVANARPELLVGVRDAVAAGNLERARALEREILSYREHVKRENALVALKRAVAERLASVRYPDTVRAPLG